MNINTKPIFLLKLVLCLSVISYTLFPDIALAIPQGMKVEEGQASIETPDPNTMVITASDKAILNFDSFSIGQNETVRFIQPLSSSSVLSRVTGSDRSDLYGSLFANGQLILVNPNGIYFAPSANIQVQSMIASTLDIQNAMYLRNELTFEKLDGSKLGTILNEANLKAADGGYIALLAESIQNKGIISANLGSVVLASGEKATLSFDDSGLINLVIDEGTKEPILNAIENQGTLEANGGKVLLSAKTLNNTMDTLINNRGLIQATKAIERDGQVEFVTNGKAINMGELLANHFRERPRPLALRAPYTEERPLSITWTERRMSPET